MPRHVQLNNVDHANIRVRTERSVEMGDAIMASPVFPHEFRSAQAHFPIVFAKDPTTAEFRPMALFGLERGENLFLGEAGWCAPYIPLAMQMAPFVIGLTERAGEQHLEVHIDTEHPRVSEEQGEPMFLSHGGQAPYLQHVSTLLGEIHQAEQSLPHFMTVLTELDLIEPFALDVTLDNGEQGRLTGYHTIAEEKLQELDGATLEQLHQSGALMAIFMAAASTSQFRTLVQLKNEKVQQG